MGEIKFSSFIAMSEGGEKKNGGKVQEGRER